MMQWILKKLRLRVLTGLNLSQDTEHLGGGGDSVGTEIKIRIP
jgi:hypothetical protein